MDYIALKKINNLFFGYEELARALGITIQAARVTASRYVKYGVLVRVKRNIYLLRERYDTMSLPERFRLANVLQTPSYISLMSVLCYYEISTQVQRNYIESIAITRSLNLKSEKYEFAFFKISSSLYNGFERNDDYFIASKEKAFTDAIYLKTLGCYNFDSSSIDFSKLDKERVSELIGNFPAKLQKRININEYF